MPIINTPSLLVCFHSATGHAATATTTDDEDAAAAAAVSCHGTSLDGIQC
jgi:hypothetical protein